MCIDKPSEKCAPHQYNYTVKVISSPTTAGFSVERLDYHDRFDNGELFVSLCLQYLHAFVCVGECVSVTEMRGKIGTLEGSGERFSNSSNIEYKFIYTKVKRTKDRYIACVTWAPDNVTR